METPSYRRPRVWTRPGALLPRDMICSPVQRHETGESNDKQRHPRRARRPAFPLRAHLWHAGGRTPGSGILAGDGAGGLRIRSSLRPRRWRARGAHLLLHGGALQARRPPCEDDSTGWNRPHRSRKERVVRPRRGRCSHHDQQSGSPAQWPAPGPAGRASPSQDPREMSCPSEHRRNDGAAVHRNGLGQSRLSGLMPSERDVVLGEFRKSGCLTHSLRPRPSPPPQHAFSPRCRPISLVPWPHCLHDLSALIELDGRALVEPLDVEQATVAAHRIRDR